MPSVKIEDKLYQDIKEYCKINGLTIGKFINEIVRKGFLVEKYDDAPPFFKKKQSKEEFEKESTNVLESIKVAINKTPEEFRQEYLNDPEPIKKEPYVKPEVISMEIKKDERALTEKEKARQRIQYL